MNLIEAIKSGRPFKRESWGKRDWESPGSWSKAFLREDVLADDWEIQEPTVTITRSQFWEAIEQIFGLKVETHGFGSVVNYRGELPKKWYELCSLARQLGLGDP